MAQPVTRRLPRLTPTQLADAEVHYRTEIRNAPDDVVRARQLRAAHLLVPSEPTRGIWVHGKLG